jgi:hypothetical protein
MFCTIKPRLAYLKVLAIQIYMSVKIMALFRQTVLGIDVLRRGLSGKP